MTHHELALTNLLTFLQEHHAEDLGYVAYTEGRASVTLNRSPKGATMLGWEWNPSPSLRGTIVHTTPSGILVIAPEFSR
jgi:hypothetical protein